MSLYTLDRSALRLITLLKIIQEQPTQATVKPQLNYRPKKEAKASFLIIPDPHPITNHHRDRYLQDQDPANIHLPLHHKPDTTYIDRLASRNYNMTYIFTTALWIYLGFWLAIFM